jgi:hypothetical protein
MQPGLVNLHRNGLPENHLSGFVLLCDISSAGGLEEYMRRTV